MSLLGNPWHFTLGNGQLDCVQVSRATVRAVVRPHSYFPGNLLHDRTGDYVAPLCSGRENQCYSSVWRDTGQDLGDWFSNPLTFPGLERQGSPKESHSKAPL